MKLEPMRFNGYSFNHNPKELLIKSEKKTAVINIPYGDDVLQNFSEGLVEISGSGELYGLDCIAQFERLCDVYKKGGEGILCLPQLPPVYACFESLKVLANDTPDVLRYSFVFRTTRPINKPKLHRKEVAVAKGDTLWDVSYRHDVPMEILCILNPQIMFVNDLSQVEKVRIC